MCYPEVPAYLIFPKSIYWHLSKFFNFFFSLKHNQYATDHPHSRKFQPSSPWFSNSQTVNPLTHIFSRLCSLYLFANNLFLTASCFSAVFTTHQDKNHDGSGNSISRPHTAIPGSNHVPHMCFCPLCVCMQSCDRHRTSSKSEQAKGSNPGILNPRPANVFVRPVYNYDCLLECCAV
jgi:hypothetical protein